MTVQRLKDLNKKNSPDIIFLQETKNPDQTVLNETEELNLDLHYLVSPHNQGAGGLALFWKNDINLQVLSLSQNNIDTLITFKDHSFHSTFVYGALEIAKRQEVWKLLTDISETRNDKPWFLMGDFNEIVDNSEKTGGKIRPESSFTHFLSFLCTCDLFDIRHTGNYLLWRGTRHTHLVHCRLDRALANNTWSEKFSNGRSHYLQFEGSDHRPIITTFDTRKRKTNKIFRYDRRLRDNTEVKEIIDKTGKEFNHLQIADRINRCRKAISTWSRKHYINSQKLITELKEKLDLDMTDLVADDVNISLLNRSLLHAYKSEEDYWKQRNRQTWLALGDRNTGYYASTKSRRARNRITVMEESSGTPVFEDEHITTVITSYFSNIFTSTNPQVLI